MQENKSSFWEGFKLGFGITFGVAVGIAITNYVTKSDFTPEYLIEDIGTQTKRALEDTTTYLTRLFKS